MNDSRPTSTDDGDDSGSETGDDESPSSVEAANESPVEAADESPAEADAESPTDTAVDGEPGEAADGDEEQPSEAELRRRVEAEYDFENFGPADMAEMSADEWEAAFDPDSWITGETLLDRVETDLERRVATRDVFAVVERRSVDGRDVVLAYSDEGYALVDGEGSVEGFGTVLRDVEPTVALCSMDSYEPEEAPAGAVLPRPDEVPEGSGELGNLMLQVIAGVLGIAGLVLLGGAMFAPGAAAGDAIGRGLMIVFGLLFLAATVVLFVTVANARLSDKFRAEEYRNRLRAVGLDDGERPSFLPIDDTDDPIDAELGGKTDGDHDSTTDGERDATSTDGGSPSAEERRRSSDVRTESGDTAGGTGGERHRDAHAADADPGDEDGSNPTT